ncbi:MAG TPA: type I 3-dehydroquinate dehydratase [Candidatus Bathyarchaeia archaeon]
MTPRICVSILPKTVEEALTLVDQAEKASADLIEIRLDGNLKHEGLAELAKHGNVQKIATNRLAKSGGQFKGSENEQKKILLNAAKKGFEYVDIELSASNLREFTTEVSENGAKPIISFHNFDRPLELSELNDVLEKEIACGADICKIVTTAKRIEDNLTLLNFTVAACKRANVVCFAMGNYGKISRLLSPIFGSFFTFAALESGGKTAPGQMTIQEMKATYRHLGLK